ncbi:glutamine-rich protein 2-like isoform X4 [Falco rusticolus]|uniref:glutamine-rich protein 2-like isoform X4 n=1 Tax=Falco rusticolus TaxID=120794 RepID=UPI001886A9FA|nr:glutamine-rich protein 2-like isoform X4 [Falco rusticolus]
MLLKRPQSICSAVQWMSREQMPEHRHPSMPLQCGGRHTLTTLLQHWPSLQPQPPSTPRLHQPHTQLPIQHNDEVELLGQDGCTYRGRRDRQLPLLVGKEVSCQDP